VRVLLPQNFFFDLNMHALLGNPLVIAFGGCSRVGAEFLTQFCAANKKSSDELKRWRYSVHQWMLLQPNLPHQPTAARIRIASKQV
jgi:hypothetical protein